MVRAIAQWRGKLTIPCPELNKQAHAAARAAERPATHPTPAEHAEQVRLLEQQHQDVGRALSEMQSTVARKEAELARLRTEKEDIEKREVGADDWNNGEAWVWPLILVSRPERLTSVVV